MWDLWRTNGHWDRFFSEFFGFPLSVSFHRRSPYSYNPGMNNMSVSGSSSETQSRHIEIYPLDVGGCVEVRTGQDVMKKKKLLVVQLIFFYFRKVLIRAHIRYICFKHPVLCLPALCLIAVSKAAIVVQFRFQNSKRV
jgi:hypothetical protein